MREGHRSQVPYILVLRRIWEDSSSSETPGVLCCQEDRGPCLACKLRREACGTTFNCVSYLNVTYMSQIWAPWRLGWVWATLKSTL